MIDSPTYYHKNNKFGSISHLIKVSNSRISHIFYYNMSIFKFSSLLSSLLHLYCFDCPFSLSSKVSQIEGLLISYIYPTHYITRFLDTDIQIPIQNPIYKRCKLP